MEESKVDKLKMESVDMAQKNIERIGALFPNVITEMQDEDGKLTKGINFELLKQELSGEVIDGEECYDFTWVGKKAAIVEGNTPIRKTLRPCIEESKNWEETGNLYIEGDNLDALKLLQESYLNSIKMIYIDPPYNTGNDFIYKDNFSMAKDDYEEQIGLLDESDNRLFKNTETNGRFHSDWCSMLYPRLKLASNLLSEDGVIFISIGQTENHNLIKICDDIYGEFNRVGIVSRMMKSGGNKGQYFSPNIEYILVYAKNLLELEYFRESISEDNASGSYNNIETSGERSGEKFTIKGLCQPGLGIRPNQRYWIECPDGSFVIPRGVTLPSLVKEGEKVLPTDEDTCWKWIYDRYKKEKEKGNIIFKRSSTATALVDENGKTAKWNVFNKIWLSDRINQGRVPVDIITKWENRVSSKELKELGIPFDFAKPTDLIKYLISLIAYSSDDIILDFFSGSSTTANAVMKLNSEDEGKRKFIMVQIPEATDEESEAYKAGYENICEIGKERIRRAGEKIKTEIEENNIQLKIGEEPKSVPDIGFRVLKIDSTNMKDVYYAANEYNQDMLASLESNIKDDRTDLDLLYGVLLDWGLPLSLSHKIEEIEGISVHTVDEGSLVACFAEKISENIVREIAKRQPLRVVFRDSSFANSPDKINVEEIFKLHAPNTSVKVI